MSMGETVDPRNRPCMVCRHDVLMLAAIILLCLLRFRDGFI